MNSFFFWLPRNSPKAVNLLLWLSALPTTQSGASELLEEYSFNTVPWLALKIRRPPNKDYHFYSPLKTGPQRERPREKRGSVSINWVDQRSLLGALVSRNHFSRRQLAS